MLETINCAAGYREDKHEREALAKSKPNLSSKRHAVVDALSQALHVLLNNKRLQ